MTGGFYLEASAPGWLYGLVKDHADPSNWSEGSRIPLLRPVESVWLIPEEPAPGWLYGLVKDHTDPSDWSEMSRIPLLRPVESASGTTFENASHFVDIHSNALVKNTRLIWRTLQKWSESLKDES